MMRIHLYRLNGAAKRADGAPLRMKNRNNHGNKDKPDCAICESSRKHPGQDGCRFVLRRFSKSRSRSPQELSQYVGHLIPLNNSCHKLFVAEGEAMKTGLGFLVALVLASAASFAQGQ